MGKFTGKVALKFARADLLPQLTARELNVTLRFGKDELSLEDASGDLAGGRLSGRIAFRTAEDGLTTRGKISVTGANAASVVALGGTAAG